jgi:hypothetical protein
MTIIAQSMILKSKVRAAFSAASLLILRGLYGGFPIDLGRLNGSDP